MRLLALVIAVTALAASTAEAGEGRGRSGRTSVDIRAEASAQASAYGSARSHFNARGYDVDGYRGGYGRDVVYLGSGYGGDFGYGGHVVVRDDRVLRGPICPSAPFGYVVTGFGRDDYRPSECGYRHQEDRYDRGGRYGYSARHESYGESRYEAREYRGAYSAGGWYEDGGAYRDERDYRDRYEDRDCDCRADRGPAPYPPVYLPEPPRYEPPRAREPRRERPRRPQPPRQRYSQEPGERG